ncbi:DUF1365 domain-containing protein [Sulfitobacter sp. F26204]|uniref:DUF1365 domain-containing protein n=1 Tax=Sulfitobacter sp. F26204 TaxID=2996014 RepID=UPI00225DF27C|nr:DUF1365 domain-containing protein [Sulfitobacter sp. F26204]MCX7561140.1 DUF1365 domain-containing protein [Sulfitobacter sp. F26204]
MMYQPHHIAAVTTHRRRGEIRNRFSYGVDFVWIDPEATIEQPGLFSRNRFNLFSVHDSDHGGALAAGKGSSWARAVLSAHDVDESTIGMRLLTQPRFLGYGFNPVSFWLAFRDDALIAVIAEVSTPFGDRHSYLCHLPEFAEITNVSRITTPKALHVSPFQDVKGSYEFKFDIRSDRIAITILHHNGAEGVIASLSGLRAPLTNRGILRASLRRPFGALRVMILIHWQALRLKLKGAKYRTRPKPPESEVT